MAGPQEHKRAAELMQIVEVLPDVTTVPDELAVIKFSGKINQRSLKIFAFGMQMKAVTVTSNKAFVRSAKMQVGFTKNVNIFVLSLDVKKLLMYFRASMCQCLHTRPEH